MQAVVIHKTGGLEVLQLVKDFPLPEIKPGQVSAASGSRMLLKQLLARTVWQLLQSTLKLRGTLLLHSKRALFLQLQLPSKCLCYCTVYPSQATTCS